METGAITSYFDVAQVSLYAFWIFFAGLVLYLRREDKREGYPLESDRPDRVTVQGFPSLPDPKVFHLAHGGTVSAPCVETDTREIKAEPIGSWPGAPLEPTGNPMIDAVGPASYALRQDKPDLNMEGEPVIAPLRVAGAFYIEPKDPDPRGMDVLGADNKSAGKVSDVWVDRSEVMIRYLEVELASPGARNTVLLPMNFARVVGAGRNSHRIRVKSILAKQFADVPSLQNPDQVTLLEEDRIVGYYAGGHLYAVPSRREPLI